jgi:hypothetical protein
MDGLSYKAPAMSLSANLTPRLPWRCQGLTQVLAGVSLLVFFAGPMLGRGLASVFGKDPYPWLLHALLPHASRLLLALKRYPPETLPPSAHAKLHGSSLFPGAGLHIKGDSRPHNYHSAASLPFPLDFHSFAALQLSKPEL